MEKPEKEGHLVKQPVTELTSFSIPNVLVGVDGTVAVKITSRCEKTSTAIPSLNVGQKLEIIL